MPRGYPDWGQYPNLAGLAVYEVSGENAARLGSPVNIFRDGLVFFMDDFRHGLGAWTDDSDPGCAFNLVTSPVRPHSPFAGQLYTPADISLYARASTIIPFFPTGAIGIQVVARAEDPPYALYVEADIYTGTRLIYAGFRLGSDGIFLRVQGGGYGPLSPVLADPLAVEGYWGSLKLVLNIATVAYTRVLSNTGFVVPTYVDLEPEANTTAPCIIFRLITHAHVPAAIWRATIGAVVVTYGES